MPTNMTQSKYARTSIVPLIFSVLAIFFSLIGLVALLIGVYHALVYLATYLWNPVVVSVLPAVIFVLMLGVIFLKQPVQNLLCLISIFFSAVVLYLYVGAEYLAFLFLIVYVGAIAILFLFVIMLLHIKKSDEASTFNFAKLLAPFPVIVVCVCFGLNDFLSTAFEKNVVNNEILFQSAEPTTVRALNWYVSNQFSDILSFSDVLYRTNAVLFFIVSLLLLTAMLGAIVLATSATDNETRILFKR
jgi:NADH-quinone oxidoreductase subunit J